LKTENCLSLLSEDRAFRPMSNSAQHFASTSKFTTYSTAAASRVYLHYGGGYDYMYTQHDVTVMPFLSHE